MFIATVEKERNGITFFITHFYVFILHFFLSLSYYSFSTYTHIGWFTHFYLNFKWTRNVSEIWILWWGEIFFLCQTWGQIMSYYTKEVNAPLRKKLKRQIFPFFTFTINKENIFPISTKSNFYFPHVHLSDETVCTHLARHIPLNYWRRLRHMKWWWWVFKVRMRGKNKDFNKFNL